MLKTPDFNYHVIFDGWLKIPVESFPLQQEVIKGGRLLLAVNQLLVQKEGKNILFDVGLGEKFSASELGLLGYENPRRLTYELANIGLYPEDIDIVVLSHLHYDHSGGGTKLTGDKLAPTFTNAVYYIQHTELEYAEHPEPGRSSDYKSEDWQPLLDSGCLEVINGEFEPVPGVELHVAPGHSTGHQVSLIRGKEHLFFAGDLFAVREHANTEVFTDFDRDINTLADQRRIWIDRAKSGNWKVFLCHAMFDKVVEL
ncbi:MBL fold metallo-hydrolase [Calditrichota bacterium]